MSATAGSGVEVVAIDTPALGDRSYLAHDGDVALVVDPQRDIDRVLDLAAARGVRITHVFETHLHNDYVTGGLALARATGAAYHVNAADRVTFDRAAVGDGDVIEVSAVMRVRVLASPGAIRSPIWRTCWKPPVTGTRCHRRIAAVRVHRPSGPAGPWARRRACARPVRLGAPARRRTAPGREHLPDPRVRQLLLGDPVRGQLLDHRPGDAGQPRAAAR